MDIAEAYKVLTEGYDRSSGAFENCCVPYFKTEYDELLKVASIAPGSRVLDLGAGTGGLSLTLARALGSKGNIVGIDMLPGWLETAEKKAKGHGFHNVEFRLMNMESLDIPDNSFDHVISNFALCCCFRYDRVVKEAYRVLKSGGKFTYNHDGPNVSDQSKILDKVYSKYKVQKPSEMLRRIREALELQESLYTRYKDPFVALNNMRAAGFRNVEARVLYLTHTFPGIDGFIDNYFWLGPDDPELLEMDPERRREMRKELAGALHPFKSDNGFMDEVETLCITGRK